LTNIDKSSHNNIQIQKYIK
jgi:hypothetical protein